MRQTGRRGLIFRFKLLWSGHPTRVPSLPRKGRGLRVEVGVPEARGGSASLADCEWRGVQAGSGGIDGGAESAMYRGKDGLVRTSGRHCEFDPADADGDDGADLE